MNTLLVILLTLVLGALILLILIVVKQQQTAADQLARNLLPHVGESMAQQFQGANQQLVLMAEQALKGKQESIATDLANKEKNIHELVKRVLDTMEQQQQRLHQSDRERVGSFEQLKTELEHQRHLTEQLKTTTESLRNVLSNNQLRGAFGEQVADDLLRMAGFVPGVDYERQTAQGEGRPDFSILLPDKMRVNIDVKFPYQSLLAYLDTDDESAKKRHLAQFRQDIKTKIKQIASREYIRPGETVDFVILLIPNEMIFSYVYDHLSDVWSEAMEQKVVLAGPFSFTAILRLIRQAHQAFKMQANTQTIVDAIREFEKEFTKYSESFDAMGKRLQLVNQSFESLDTTRRRQLQKAIDKIQLIEEADEPNRLIE